MSKGKQNQSTETPASESADAVVPEIVDAPTSTALSPAAAENAAAVVKTAADQAADFLATFGQHGDKIRALAVKFPKYAEQLGDLEAYTATSIEGVMGDRTVTIPRISIRQQMTKADSAPEACKPGEFYTTNGECLGSQVKFIPLLHHVKRAKFVQGQDRPDCQSDDGINGSKYGRCDGCPFQRVAEGQKPQCSSGHSYIVTNESFGALYQLDFMKTSAKYGRKIQQTLSPRGLFASKYFVKSDKETKPQGTYFITPVMPAGEKVEGDEFEIARELSRFLTARYRYFAARRLAAAGASALASQTLAGNAGGAGEAAAGDVPDM